MAVYDEKQREEYATIGKSKFPIGDKNHARAALSRINQGGLTPEQKAAVIRKANAMLARK